MSNGNLVFVDEIVDKIVALFPTQKYIRKLFSSLSIEEKSDFGICLDCISKVYDISGQELVDCYSMFCEDTLEESKFFLENGRYRYSKYDEVKKYMELKHIKYMQRYQIGLFISLFLWPNHFEMRHHLIDFLNKTKDRRKEFGTGGAYIEVGVGHGYYFYQALRILPFEYYLGIDINEDSLNMTRNVIEHRSISINKRYQLLLADFFDLSEDGYYDMIILGEILEHVEHPEMFLRKIYDLANSNADIYITTAINAPAVDHIYNFETPERLEEIFRTAGLEVINMDLFLYRNNSLERCLKWRMPITVAVHARKK